MDELTCAEWLGSHLEAAGMVGRLGKGCTEMWRPVKKQQEPETARDAMAVSGVPGLGELPTQSSELPVLLSCLALAVLQNLPRMDAHPPECARAGLSSQWVSKSGTQTSGISHSWVFA